METQKGPCKDYSPSKMDMGFHVSLGEGRIFNLYHHGTLRNYLITLFRHRSRKIRIGSGFGVEGLGFKFRVWGLGFRPEV